MYKNQVNWPFRNGHCNSLLWFDFFFSPVFFHAYFKSCALVWELKISKTKFFWSAESIKFSKETDNNQPQDNVFIQGYSREQQQQKE